MRSLQHPFPVRISTPHGIRARSIQAPSRAFVGGRGFARRAQLRAQPTQRDRLGGSVVIQRIEQQAQVVIEVEFVLGQHVFDFGQARRVVGFEGVRDRVAGGVLRGEVGRGELGAGEGWVGGAELAG